MLVLLSMASTHWNVFVWGRGGGGGGGGEGGREGGREEREGGVKG